MVFIEDVMDMWLDNSEIGDMFLFCEVYEDYRNLLYFIVNYVCVNVSFDDKGLKCY